MKDADAIDWRPRLGWVPGSGVVARLPKDEAARLLLTGQANLLPPERKLSRQWRPNGLALVEFHADVAPQHARTVLREAGLDALPAPSLRQRHALVRASRAQVAALVNWDEVAYVLPADPDLLTGGGLWACDGAHTEWGEVGQLATPVGDGWDGPGRQAASLRWALGPVPASIPPDALRDAVQRATAEWSRVAQIRWSETTDENGPATVRVLAAHGSHGDAWPFDGLAGVLAHTFYPNPPNREPLAGDIHLDAAEGWATPDGPDLYSVILHELGHSLGLAHSDVPGSVMYPYYSRLSRLTVDDERSILEVYAAAPKLRVLVTEPPLESSAETVELTGTLEGGRGALRVAWATASSRGDALVDGRTWRAVVPLTIGENRVDVTVQDADGERDTAPLRIVRAVPSTPTLVELSITPTARTGAETTTISGTARHPSGITSVRATVDDVTLPVLGTSAWTAGPVPLRPGLNRVSVTAVARDGTTGSAATTVERAAVTDTVSPTLSVRQPSASVVATTATTINFAGAARDNVGVAEVTWTNAAGGSGVATGTTAWSVTNLPLQVGLNTLTIRARDAAGNVAWRSVAVTRR